MIRKILKTTDNLEFLHQKSTAVDSEWIFFIELLVKDLKDTAAANKLAVGLAAPQIGEPYRVFVFKYKGKWQEIINPEITYHSKARISIKEECLSVPNQAVKILRYKKITAKGQDVKGNSLEFKLNDFDSILFQHELDHLDGKLICDYIPAVAKR